MEIYLIKSSIALTIVYSFYWLLLRNETYFGWNRVYLISSILISLISPLLKITSLEKVGTNISNMLEPVIISNQRAIISENHSLNILSIIYISGAVFFTLKFLSKLSQIYYLYYRFPKVQYKGFRVVLVDGELSPFTFFSILFLSRSDFEKGNIDEMVVHERAHKEQRHSLDVILLELTTIIQWFNPFVWLIRMAIRAEHEFFADERVLKEGFDMVAYQRLLFEKSLGVTELGVTSNFNYSLLKNRLKMMTIKKSSSTSIVKYFFALPLLLSMCLILSTNMKVHGQEKIYDVVEKMPQYGNGDNDLRMFVARNMKYPESAAELGVQGRIYLQFIVSDMGKVKDIRVIKVAVPEKVIIDKEIVVTALKKDKDGKIEYKDYKSSGNAKIDQAYKDLENEAIRVMMLIGDFTPGEEKGKKVNVSFTFPITFVLQ
jgi:hypothetical protein